MNHKILMNSVIGKDFLLHREHPDTDVFLDYRNSLSEQKSKDKRVHPYLDHEIAAVDEILRILNTK